MSVIFTDDFAVDSSNLVNSPYWSNYVAPGVPFNNTFSYQSNTFIVSSGKVSLLQPTNSDTLSGVCYFEPTVSQIGVAAEGTFTVPTGAPARFDVALGWGFKAGYAEGYVYLFGYANYSQTGGVVNNYYSTPIVIGMEPFTISENTPYAFRIERLGTTMTLKVDGNIIITSDVGYSINPINQSMQPGFILYSNITASVTMDDFVIDLLGTSGTATTDPRIRWADDGTTSYALSTGNIKTALSAANRNKLDGDNVVSDTVSIASGESLLFNFPGDFLLSKLSFKGSTANTVTISISTDSTDGVSGTWNTLTSGYSLTASNNTDYNIPGATCTWLKVTFNGSQSLYYLWIYGVYDTPKFDYVATDGTSVLTGNYPFIFSNVGNDTDKLMTSAFKIHNNGAASHTYSLVTKSARYGGDKEVDEHVAFAMSISAQYWKLTITSQQGDNIGKLNALKLFTDLANANGETPFSSTAGTGTAANAHAVDATTWDYTLGATSWLRFDLGSAKTILGYALVNSTDMNQSPTGWTLQYSTNDTDWVTIDTRTVVSNWIAGNIERKFCGSATYNTESVTSGSSSNTITLKLYMPRLSNPVDGTHMFYILGTEI